MLTSAQAQFDFDNVFVGGNIGYIRPIGDFSDFAKGGFYLNGIAGYKLDNQLGVGVQFQSSIVGAVNSGDTGLFGVNLYGLNSYMAKGWYSFTQSKTKPYAALGLGIASVAEPDVTFTDGAGNESTITGAKRAGLATDLELGVSFNGFNLSYNFNIGGKTPKAVINGADTSIWVLYHTFNIGYVYNF